MTLLAEATGRRLDDGTGTMYYPPVQRQWPHEKRSVPIGAPGSTASGSLAKQMRGARAVGRQRQIILNLI
jgi:hypothetical protein